MLRSMSLGGSEGARMALAGALIVSLSAACSCKRDATPSTRRASASAPVSHSTSAPSTPPAAPADKGIHYHVTLNAEALSLDVRICPRDVALKQLSAPINEAVPLLHDPRVAGESVTVADDVITLAGLPPGRCASYQVKLQEALGGRGMDVRHSGDDLLLSPDLWMWTPEPRPQDAAITARFVLPAQWSAALPWPRLSDGRYRIPESAFVWRTQGAFGTLPQHTIKTGGAEVSAYVLGEGWGERHDAVLKWVRGSAEAVTALFGRFPTTRAQALLVTTPAGSSTFGMAMHGGGMSTFVLLPADLDTTDIDARWTVVHELLHFSLPPVVNRDAWLHEGITTYLTTKARARAGLIDASFAWWELLDGFERGRSRGSGRTLREESAAMRQTHQYWRVYWAGAAMALAMDMELTERGDSLEKTLLDLADQKVDHGHRWEGTEILKLLDRACGSTIASDACTPHLDKSEFPDTDSLARQLGVRIAGKHKSVFDDTAPKTSLRRKLMAARQP